jgi:hypothetical protein
VQFLESAAKALVAKLRQEDSLKPAETLGLVLQLDAQLGRGSALVANLPTPVKEAPV